MKAGNDSYVLSLGFPKLNKLKEKKSVCPFT